MHARKLNLTVFSSNSFFLHLFIATFVYTKDLSYSYSNPKTP